jgi:hypothetical protein
MKYSLNQVTYELLDLYRARIAKTDDIDIREIKRWIRLQRSLWLRNEYSKTRDIDDSVEQDLGAVPMIYVDNNFKPLYSGTAIKAKFTSASTTVSYYKTDEITSATTTYVLPIGQKLTIGLITYTVVTSSTSGFTININYTGTTDYLLLTSEIATPILMSQRMVPTVVELYDRPCFTRVAPIVRLGYSLLPFVPITRMSFVGSGRFNANQIYTFQYNSYIGIYSPGNSVLLSNIFNYGLNVTGVFEDPIEAGRYPEVGDIQGIINGASTTKYFDDDSEWPIHDWMIQYMKNSIMQGEAQIANQETQGYDLGQLKT